MSRLRRLQMVVVVLGVLALALRARAEDAGAKPAGKTPQTTGVKTDEGTPAKLESSAKPGEASGEKEAKGAPGFGEGVPAEKTIRLVPYEDYRGDFFTSAVMTGDWWGGRQKLMEKGVRFDLSMTQLLQGAMEGGIEQDAHYTGRLDYGVRFDTGPMGLWPGGMFKVRAQTRYGPSDNREAGAVSPVDTISLYPVPGKNSTCLTDAFFAQFLAEWIGVVAGKFEPRDSNVFASNETTQFLNTSFNYNPVMGTTFPLDFLSAGVILIPVKPLTILTAVMDPYGEANTSGFDTAFNGQVSIFQSAELAIKPFGLDGNQRLSWTWSNESKIPFTQDSRVILESILQGQRPTLARVSRDGTFMYDFDQYLYNVPGKKDQGIGLFGRFGVGDDKVNPVATAWSIGVGGKGMFGRDKDSFGVGYYYIELSDKLPRIIKRFTQDEQGVELYYNIAVTPWVHLTPDLQVIDAGRSRADTAVVGGLRMKVDF